MTIPFHPKGSLFLPVFLYELFPALPAFPKFGMTHVLPLSEKLSLPISFSESGWRRLGLFRRRLPERIIEPERRYFFEAWSNVAEW